MDFPFSLNGQEKNFFNHAGDGCLCLFGMENLMEIVEKRQFLRVLQHAGARGGIRTPLQVETSPASSLFFCEVLLLKRSLFRKVFSCFCDNVLLDWLVWQIGKM